MRLGSRLVRRARAADVADAPAATGRVEAYVPVSPPWTNPRNHAWNFPLWQATRMGIPTLLAGNVVYGEALPQHTGGSLELERMMLKMGFPEGVLQNLILKTEDIVDVVDDHGPGTSVTGSVRADLHDDLQSQKVDQEDGDGAGQLDAFIVLEDADIRRQWLRVSRDVSVTRVRFAWPQNGSFWSKSPTSLKASS